MNWIRPAAIGAGAALAGLAVATQTHDLGERVSAKAGERYWDRQYSGEDRSATDYYGGSAVFAGIGAVGLAVGGFALLTRPSLATSAMGGAAIAGGVALMGASVGMFKGFSAGETASDEKHGVDIEQQADRLIKNFDHDKDKALSTDDSGRPEFLYRYEVDYHRDSLPNETKWASIENFVQAADANGDAKATRQEIVDKMRSYDVNGNGLLSVNDSRKYMEDGLEHVAIEERILAADPWGMYHTVEW